MKNKMTQTLGATLLASAMAFGGSAAQAEGELLLYNWFEYMPQELLDKFTAETGIKVTQDTFDSNEAMLASLKAGSLGSYDLAVPSDYMVKIMITDGLLQEVGPDKLKNFANMSAQWVDVPFDPGRKYSIPYQWGSTAFSVNRDDFKGDINTTAIIFDPPEELQGKINVLDSQGEVMALASIHMGFPQCSSDREQLRALDDMLQAAKGHWASINSDTSKDVLVSGDAAASMIWGGFGAKAREEGANVEYAFPVEGYVVWMDNVVLLKDAPNPENAIKFMDFLLQPENVAQISNFARYATGVDGVEPFLDNELATMPENNPPPEIPTQFVAVCDEETQTFYDRIWTRVKE